MQESYLTSRARPITPAGEVQHYQTYTVRAGSDVTVVAACKDSGCQAWAHGWQTTVDERIPGSLGTAQATYIRTKSGRTFTERKTLEGLTVFRFEAFQRCFQEHRTKPDVFIRRHGDWRGNPSGTVYRHTNAQNWIEDFAENQQRIVDRQQEG